jgi:thiol-disulfide isomerase/thioredoxin
MSNSSTAASAIKRIRNAPLTVVLIYANWCGHCHSYMPFFDKMSKTQGRSANMVKVEDKALPAFNAALTTNFPNAIPIEPEGYPTLLAVGKNGRVVSSLPVVREEAPNAKMIRSVGNIAASIPKPETVESQTLPTESVPASTISSRQRTINELPVPITPPTAESDISPEVENLDVLTQQRGEILPEPSPRLVGGSGLYGALVDATYQLAPAAVLTGIAAGMPRRLMTNRKNKTRKGRM